MKKKLLIIGAGGFGREVMSIALDVAQEKHTEWELYGFLDDNTGAFEGLDTLGYKILDTISGHIISDEFMYTCAIADAQTREKICDRYMKAGAKFVNIIHQTCRIGYTAKMGIGIIMSPYSSISENVTIKDFTIINAYTGIGHDAVIGDYCTLSAHCDITGHTELGKGVFLGSSSVISPGITVGEYARVGAGSIVLRKVKPNTTVFGNPAKRIY